MKTFFFWMYVALLFFWVLISAARTILAFQGTLEPLDPATDAVLHWLIVALATNGVAQAYLDKEDPRR